MDEKMDAKKPSIYILNGPNLDQLGRRAPEIYGKQTLKDIEKACLEWGERHHVSIVFRQTNYEGQLIEWVHEAALNAQALVINAAGLTHTSVSLLDALLLLTIPIYEVHLSQIYKREPFRHFSYVSQSATGVIAGFGLWSYILALEASQKLS